MVTMNTSIKDAVGSYVSVGDIVATASKDSSRITWRKRRVVEVWPPLGSPSWMNPGHIVCTDVTGYKNPRQTKITSGNFVRISKAPRVPPCA